MDRCKTHTLQLVSVFPRNTEEERRLFNLLQDAYVQARYNKDFVVTKTDIDALIPRLELMRDITEKSVATGSPITNDKADIPLNPAKDRT